MTKSIARIGSVLQVSLKALWIRYLMALALIACTATIMFAFSRATGSTAEVYNQAINVAGNQRMLSQRIAYFVERIDPTRPTESQERDREALKQAIDLFEARHKALVTGRFVGYSRTLLPDEVKAFYQGTSFNRGRGWPDLNGQSDNFVSDARLALSGSLSDYAAAKSRIEFTAPYALLNDLDVAVELWEQAANKSVQTLRMIEKVALAITLLLLALEARFVFWPAHHTILKAFQRVEEERDRAMAAGHAAEQAALARRVFLERMTHELRTPLTAIIGRSELIKEDLEYIASSEPSFQSLTNDALKITTEANSLLDIIHTITEDAVTSSGGQSLAANDSKKAA